jgi:multidrug efflux pump subunit AcrB
LGQETVIELDILHQKLSAKGIVYIDFKGKLEQVFGEYTITEIKNYGELTPILLRGNNAESWEVL